MNRTILARLEFRKRRSTRNEIKTKTFQISTYIRYKLFVSSSIRLISLGVFTSFPSFGLYMEIFYILHMRYAKHEICVYFAEFGIFRSKLNFLGTIWRISVGAAPNDGLSVCSKHIIENWICELWKEGLYGRWCAETCLLFHLENINFKFRNIFF